MYKQYKTVRIARETKYWLNELILFKESELKDVKDTLIEKHETQLKKNPDFSHGFSPTLSIAVTSGSILEAAYIFVESRKDKIDWNSIISEMNNEKNKIDSDLDVGTLTPRFYLSSDVLDGLEKHREELKSPQMQRNLMLNYVIKIVIYCYYKAVI